MENKEITLTPEQKREKGWISVAAKSHALDVSLQSKSIAIIIALSVLPELNTAEAIAGYEANLKKIKQDISEICSERMEFTAILDTVKGNKMKFEKEAAAALPPFEAALLKVKKEKQDADAKIKAKADEISALRLSFANHITQQRAAMETMIIHQVATLFTMSVIIKKPIEEIEAYLAENALLPELFKLPKYSGGKGINITTEEAGVIMHEIWGANIIDPAAMIASYNSQVDEKFGNKESNYWLYTLSLKNVDDALALSASETSAQLAATNDTALNVQVANRLQTVAAPIAGNNAQVKTRGLKKVWSLNMEDSEATAVTVWAAFIANWAICKPHLRLKGAALMNLSTKQMAAALVDVKAADEAFSVTGVVFKVEEKL